MRSNTKRLRRPALASALIALCVAAGSAPSAAQSERCTDLYSRVMVLYQTGPYSPEYSRMANYYSARCLVGGPSADPGYPDPYQRPYPWH
jgi:hypothetical protein